jgi:hypothetical protein
MYLQETNDMKQKTNNKNFDTIARQYKVMRQKYPDLHIDFCVQQKSLVDAIVVAAKAINEQNKIHGHQRRIGRVKLNEFAEQLKLKETAISKAKNFDNLLSIIKQVKMDGIADLTYYDTATRIGAYLNLFPDKIYLHTGTRVGAQNLLGSLNGKTFLQLNELPKEFRKHDLTASEFEDILCIFKNDFKQPFLNAWKKAGRPC